MEFDHENLGALPLIIYFKNFFFFNKDSTENLLMFIFFFFFFFFFCLQKPILVFFSDVIKLLENTEVETAKSYKLRFLSHMKAIKTNTDARRLLNIHYKEKCLCFKGTDVMSLVFVAVERCVFFSSFLPISHSEVLKNN